MHVRRHGSRHPRHNQALPRCVSRYRQLGSAQLKLAFAFYCQTPFGKLHSRYMYRDAANYKAGGQLLLDGEYSEAAETVIREHCDSWNYFVVKQVDVPVLYAELYQFSNGPTIDDIAFHEFENLRAAMAEDVASTQSWGTLDDLVARFRAVEYWDCTLSPHCE